MTTHFLRSVTRPVRGRRAALLAAATVLAGIVAAVGQTGGAQAHEGFGPWFQPGNLVVSGSDYVGQAALFTPGVSELPPGCPTSAGACTPAVADGTYPYVFNNDASDGSFGVTSPIFLDQITPDGHLVNTLRVPDGDGPFGTAADHMVTSFSSKSELALNLSTNGRDLTFMGYLTPPNSDRRLELQHARRRSTRRTRSRATYYRAVARGESSRAASTSRSTNAYSGNNGRAAILNNSRGNDVLYTAGNAGNGGNPQPDGVITRRGRADHDAAAQRQSRSRLRARPTPVGSFNVTQLGDKADKIGKDTNFRGLTIYNNVVYFTKGSGGNGVNTVYFVDTHRQAPALTGVGVPPPGATLPTSPIAYNPALLQTRA